MYTGVVVKIIPVVQASEQDLFRLDHVYQALLS